MAAKTAEKSNDETIRSTREAVGNLIVKLCNDVANGKVRDEYRTYDAIAALTKAIIE